MGRIRSIFCCFCLFLIVFGVQAKTEVKIGVLAFRGTDLAVSMWTPTADYLTKEIPGYRFVIVPVSNDNIEKLVKNTEVDFILTNPASYAYLEAGYGITRILTLVNNTPYGGLTQYGAVVFTHIDNRRIRDFQDLKGKSIMAVHPDAFGGWWMAWRELKRNHVNPYKEMDVRFSGFPQDTIVQAVSDRSIDVGVVRTNVLERMANQGKIDLKRLHILNNKKTLGFPYALSTQLYPEWPLATLKHIPGPLAEQVVLALLKLNDSHPATQSAKIAGWTVPLDYLSVHQLMKDLSVGHYQAQSPFTIRQVWQRYWLSIVIVGTTVLGLLFTVLIISRLNRQLKHSHRQLREEIVERQKVKTELTKLGTILDKSPGEIYVFNVISKKLVHINQSAKTKLNYGEADLKNIYITDIFHAFPEFIQAKIDQSVKKEEDIILHCETAITKQSGESCICAVQIQLYHEDYTPTLICLAQDISEFKKAEQELNHERQRNEIALQSITDAIISTDDQGRIEYLNAMAESFTGVSAGEARGKFLSEVVTLTDQETGKKIPTGVESGLQHGEFNTGEQSRILVSSTGNKIAVEESVVPRYNQDDKLAGIVLVLRDKSELHQLNERINYYITHDELTGLVNRRVFENEIKEAIRNANLNHTRHALLYLDLDQFKVVNEACGHQGGDEFLKQLTFQLKPMVRGCDTLARLGADQFGVLLRGCSEEDARLAASRMQEVINLFPFAWNGNVMHVGVSIGIVPIVPGIGKLRDVLNAADAACFVAKDNGRNRIYVYNNDDEEVQRHQGDMRCSQMIKRALDENRFQLYFQPIVPLSQEKGIQQLEVLLRLINISGEMVMPKKFIPAAERYQLMPRIDKWVIDNTFKFMRDNAVGSYRFNINLSGQSLCDDGFLHFITDSLSRYGIDSENVCFEITETAAITNFREATRLIQILRQKGILFALDDFGNGLSSFHYLKRLNADYLKIDGGYVRNMLRDDKDYAIVEAMNNIAHMMGMQTVAEFVESDKIKKALSHIGIDYAQGFVIAKPKPLSHLLASSTT